MASAVPMAEPTSDTTPRCRFCDTPLTETVADLGVQPPSNHFRHPRDRLKPEPFYPLHAFVCGGCFLVQVETIHAPNELFPADYAYFSSFAESWLDHAKRYSAMMTERLGLGPDSQVIEVASNDGYLLQYFHQRGIPVLGIEPAANVAEAARAKGLETQVAFFGKALGGELKAAGRQADLLIGNNVLAHVPDLNDFVAGLALALRPDGVLTMEFPHLLRLMAENQFDTIYHEHFSYFSALTVMRVFAAHGLELFDVETLPTHGGSLRVFVGHQGHHPIAARVGGVLAAERDAGLDTLDVYRGFSDKVAAAKRDLLGFLIEAKDAGKRIVGYGAPAKGNTLLNYCGVRGDFLDYTVDRSPHKQGLLLPGTGIPIHAPDRIYETKPDYVLILPWNLRGEIMEQMAGIRAWGGRFVTPIPTVTVHA